jgi:hypothetical protein
MAAETLVCVLAETRAHALTWQKFKKNLLDTLDAELAVCIETPEGYDYGNEFWRHAKYHWTTQGYDDWSKAFDSAQSELGATDDWRVLLNVKSQWLGGVDRLNGQAGSAGILLYFRLFLIDCLKRDKIFEKYKRVIVTRSDFIWNVTHPTLSLLDPQAIWIPNGEGYGGLTDRHAVLSKSNYIEYLNILAHALKDPVRTAAEMSARSDWNLERFIFHSLAKAGATVKLFPYPAFSVREWGGPTSWSKGRWNFKMGCFVKYPSELREVHRLSALLESGVSWSEIISSGAVDPHGMWALNASIASPSHKRLKLNGRFAGISFQDGQGILATTKSTFCARWKDVDRVNVRQENNRVTITSWIDDKYYSFDGERMLKKKKFDEDCLFFLEPASPEVNWTQA